MIQTMLIIKLVILFVIYIVAHALLLIKVTNIKKQIDENPGNIEKEKIYKRFNVLCKWFPALYVVFVLFVLYMV